MLTPSPSQSSLPTLAPPVLEQNTCCGLPSPLCPPHPDLLLQPSTLPIPVSQPSTPAGIPWELACHPSRGASWPAKQVGKLLIFTPPPPVLQTNPLVSPPSLQQNICCGHTSHSAPPQPIDKHIFSSNLPSLQLIPLPQLPSPAGISWDSVGHTGQGRRQTNCRSSSLSPL